MIDHSYYRQGAREPKDEFDQIHDFKGTRGGAAKGVSHE